MKNRSLTVFPTGIRAISSQVCFLCAPSGAAAGSSEIKMLAFVEFMLGAGGKGLANEIEGGYEGT